MTLDILILFGVFITIFIGGIFWFLSSSAKDLVKTRLLYSPKSSDGRKGAETIKATDSEKVATLYREPPDPVESKGYLKLTGDGALFYDLYGAEILHIPYSDIIECYLDTPGIGRRSMLRLAVSWASLPIPILRRVRYLNIRYNKNGAQVLLSFIYSDMIWDYLKGLVADINSKIKK